jgi:hypothetical protein
MTVTTNREFARRLTLLARPAEEFKPTASYDRDGDCIEFLAKPDVFYAERIDDLVTVYYSQETDEVIGSLIKGVSQFCRELEGHLPGFKIEIHDGPVRLQHIFLARMWSAPLDPQGLATLTYRKLIEVSRDAVVEGELCMA